MERTARFLACGIFLVVAEAAAQGPLQSSDLLKMRSVTAVEVSPDGARAAYVVENNDGTGRPYGQLWVMTLADGKSVRFGKDQEPTGNPEWSPDSQSIAYRGQPSLLVLALVIASRSVQSEWVQPFGGWSPSLLGA